MALVSWYRRHIAPGIYNGRPVDRKPRKSADDVCRPEEMRPGRQSARVGPRACNWAMPIADARILGSWRIGIPDSRKIDRLFPISPDDYRPSRRPTRVGDGARRS